MSRFTLTILVALMTVSAAPAYGMTEKQPSLLEVLGNEAEKAQTRREGYDEGYKEGYRDGEANGRNEEFLNNYEREHGGIPGPVTGGGSGGGSEDMISPRIMQSGWPGGEPWNDIQY